MDGLKDRAGKILAKDESTYIARLLSSVACPSCNYAMYTNDDGTIQCGMDDCAFYHRRFQAPLTLISEVEQ